MVEKKRSARDIERDRGILTPQDRRFLLGNADYKQAQSARRRRAQIRSRVTNAILDFVFLQYVEERDREQIFAGEENREQLAGGFSRAFLFLYDGLARTQVDNKHVDMNLAVYLEQAIETVDFQRGYHSEFEMNIERTELDDPEEIFRRVQQEGFDSVTGPEFDQLWFSEEVDPAAFASFLNQLFDEEEENISPRDIQKERRAMREHEEELGG